MKIAPSILSADFAYLKRDVEVIEQGGADWVHIDVMDGSFVPNITFGPNIVEAIRPHTSLPLDVHLMIDNPERYIGEFAKAGADYISVQVESTKHIHRAIQMIKDYNVKVGVVLNPGTPVEAILPVLNEVDLVLVMSVNPGFGGQAFIPYSLDKIHYLNQIRKENNFNYKLQVDGGVNEQTGKLCHEAGADILVAGSFIFSNDNPVQEQIAILKGLA